MKRTRAASATSCSIWSRWGAFISLSCSWRLATRQTANTRLPLAGLRILAVEQYGAGPFGRLYLADLGAKVDKVEEPKDGGDVGRQMPHTCAERRARSSRPQPQQEQRSRWTSSTPRAPAFLALVAARTLVLATCAASWTSSAWSSARLARPAAHHCSISGVRAPGGSARPGRATTRLMRPGRPHVAHGEPGADAQRPSSST